MKKIYKLLILLSLMSSLNSQTTNQSQHVSKLFNCTFSKNIHASLDTKPHNNIYATYDSALFVVKQRGFGKEGVAKIIKINAFTGLEDNYLISIPSDFIRNGGKIERIWIWALSANDSVLCLAVDEGIWVYHSTTSKQYEYEKTIFIEDVSNMQIVNHVLHAFIMNDNGYDWIKINVQNSQIENVRSLVLKNHFFLQIGPVKLISVSNNALYFLQRNEPIIEKYSLTGEFISEYAIQIPNWRKISDEVTRKLDSIEDITERSYAFSKFSIFDYNFMHLFYVFPSERFFMIAIDKNINTETFVTPYFIQIIGDSTFIEPYSVTLSEHEQFGEKLFPFLTQNAEGNVLFASMNECVTQVNNTTDVSWLNKTLKEYQHDVNLYHRDNDPIEKVETYKFIKNNIPVDSICFLDYDDHVFCLNDVEKEKAVFIISQFPQCSSCAKVLWNYFSHKAQPHLQLYTVTLDCHSYLMKKENIKEVNAFLKTEYIPLYLDTKRLNPATKQILSQKSNPIILMFDKKLQHIELYSAANIIGDLMGNLNPKFLHAIDNFLGE